MSSFLREWYSKSQHPALLGMALVLTTATQFRFSNIPVGLGEVLLVTLLIVWWSGYCSGSIPLASQRMVAWCFGCFWAIALICLSIGAWIGIQTGLNQLERMEHDFLAYVLGFVSSLTIALLPGTRVEIERRLLALTLCSLVCGSGLWLLAYGYPSLNELLWYNNQRFRGWAANPNQMALLLLWAPFLSFFFMERFTQKLTRVWQYSGWIVLTATALAAGWTTASDALRGAWISVIPLLAGAWLIDGVFRGNHASMRNLLRLIATLSLAVGLLFVAHWIAAYRVTDNGMMPQIQGTIRLKLLEHGIDAWLASPWFGLGPGSHSGFWRAFQGIESHNSLVDWATNTGIIGLFALLSLGGCVVWRVWQTRQWTLLAALMVLVVFAQAHHTLRHPLVWAWLVLMTQWSQAEPANPYSGASIYPNLP